MRVKSTLRAAAIYQRRHQGRAGARGLFREGGGYVRGGRRRRRRPPELFLCPLKRLPTPRRASERPERIVTETTGTFRVALTPQELGRDT
ncbi:hypothetical protein EVAR_737_1 [Eumeta japonica]|uniref:Uncharacterized protein n=1 Tax=Eumeta variegata TaxID=151549 RepID=A0A4C1SBP9_EUMVA|nr:hypothetical protein EVAR_737_1 [Eumeta japonica]